MERRNTKERILDEALDLFSKRGYDGVGMRELAAAVGIRESSVYKHYAGKQGIFDALMEKMERRYREAEQEFRVPQGDLPSLARQYETNGLDALKEMCCSYVLFYVRDPFASKFMRMLTMEQYKSEQAGETLRRQFIEEPLKFHAALFAQMMKDGYFRPMDPQVMALHFFAPMFLMRSFWDGSLQREEELLDLVRRHIDQFAALYAAQPPKGEPL